MEISKQSRIYFHGLDELRAIAALLVYFHHVELFKSRESYFSLYDIKYTQGFIAHIGHTSVICFFVLSGFLITYLLLKEKQLTGTIHIKEFYIRRILRIWPLYFFVLLIAFLLLPALQHFVKFGGQTYYPNLIETINYNALPLFIFFLSNIAMVYFKPVAGAAQSWSVSVEEQFYLIWPWIVKYSKGIRFAFICILTLLILKIAANYAGVLLTGKRSMLSMVLSKISIEYMCIGALGAFVIYSDVLRDKLRKVLMNKFSLLLVVALILLECVRYNHAYLLAVLFAVFILLIVTQEITIGFLKYFGKISYGIYMLHPVCIFVSFSLAAQFKSAICFNSVLYLASFGLTIGFAAFSYRFIERPFLQRKKKHTIIQSGSL